MEKNSGTESCDMEKNSGTESCDMENLADCMTASARIVHCDETH